jgi:hypothetical protein
MLAAPALLLAIAVWAGTSGTFWNATTSAAHAFVNRGAYVSAVLRDAPIAIWSFKPHLVTAEDLAINVAVVLAAVVAAFAGLFRDHIPQKLNPVFGPPLKLLRGMHSGIFTDYVAYIVFGIAAYSAWLVIGMK